MRAAILEREDLAALGARQHEIGSPANAARCVRPGLTSFDLASGYQKSG